MHTNMLITLFILILWLITSSLCTNINTNWQNMHTKIYRKKKTRWKCMLVVGLYICHCYMCYGCSNGPAGRMPVHAGPYGEYRDTNTDRYVHVPRHDTWTYVTRVLYPIVHFIGAERSVQGMCQYSGANILLTYIAWI